MAFDINKAAAWVGLATALGAGIGWWRSSVADAQHLQQAKDYFYQRIGNDEGDIAFIKSQLPKDKQDILDAIHEAQERAQHQQRVEETMAQKAIIHKMDILPNDPTDPDKISADMPRTPDAPQ